MIFLFGDSHARISFSSLSDASNHATNSITMFRIGRDDHAFMDLNTGQRIVPLDATAVFCYGEVDCRCHIGRQPTPPEVTVDSVATAYISSIIKHAPQTTRVMICAVPPPTKQHDFEQVNGPITHEFPFVGSDADRSYYTTLMNARLKELCQIHDLIFLDPFDHVRDDQGLMIFPQSDRTVHVKDSEPCVTRLMAKLTHEMK